MDIKLNETLQESQIIILTEVITMIITQLAAQIAMLNNITMTVITLAITSLQQVTELYATITSYPQKQIKCTS